MDIRTKNLGETIGSFAAIEISSQMRWLIGEQTSSIINSTIHRKCKVPVLVQTWRQISGPIWNNIRPVDDHQPVKHAD